MILPREGSPSTYSLLGGWASAVASGDSSWTPASPLPAPLGTAPRVVRFTSCLWSLIPGELTRAGLQPALCSPRT